MNRLLLLSFLLGVYGYIAFVLILITARKLMKGEDFFWPRVRGVFDSIMGASSLILSLEAEGKIKAVFLLYGTSLLLSALRGVLKVPRWPVAARKVFNYVANSYIVLAMFMMGVSMRGLTEVDPTIILIIFYFVTYRVVWRGSK
ncbi:MAG: hypothetical protein PWP39_144 [Pyrococcus sp.]|uniref:hypothetical protein n=1 Tax=Pyrococcus sp. TaxID=33866 RepID=UPI00258D4709|nr:hypothetical protein [Pyrococcus sp.]MDK2868909.1 hypothetical protein [Pyrococcus sp.]